MDRIKGGGGLLLVAASVALSALIVEAFFSLFSGSERIYPLVYYQTEEPQVKLWCYDEHFEGIPDWDLRQDHPFGKLTYLGNAARDSSLADLAPLHVPNAIEVRLNPDQLRERPLAEFGAPGAKIILVIGDSFGFGQGVRLEERFSNILETRLKQRRSGQNYRIFNACRPGMNIKRIAATMERYLDYFSQVERVVYSFTLNDPFRSGRLLAREKELGDFMHRRSRARAARFLAGRDSYALRWLNARLQQRQLARDTVEWYNELYSNYLGWKMTRELLTGMNKQCLTRGIEFSLVVFPVFYQLNAYPLAEVHETLRTLAQRNRIDYVDLLPLFAGKDERVYWVHPTDFHPNGWAHKEAADFLYGAISW